RAAALRREVNRWPYWRLFSASAPVHFERVHFEPVSDTMSFLSFTPTMIGILFSSTSLSSRVVQPAISLLFEFVSKLLASRLDDPSTGKNVQKVGKDVVQQPLIMCHEDDRAILAAQGVASARHHLERVDVQTRVGLIQNRKRGLEHRHLKNLVALF